MSLADIVLPLLLALPDGAAELDRVVVTGRDLDPGAPRSTARLDAAELESIRPTHPSEVFARIPGAWITRGSGQEHLSAIRSPLLTGAGGCGALLILEEGIPIRPPGFCNVNNLFEVNLLQAGSVSVLRGPGGLGHASGGLHGVIDVRTRPPLAAPSAAVRGEAGSDEFRRLELTGTVATGDAGRLRLDGNFTDAGSFRDEEGYDHHFLTLHHATAIGRAGLETVVTGAALDQDTAGFITGFNAFRDPDRRTDNDNPEAFRRGSAVRAVSRFSWIGSGGAETRITGFARRSRMTFLQHFLPGQPLERNGQVSGGLQLDRSRLLGATEFEWGLDAEAFDGFLFQAQEHPAQGPPAVVAIRPVGRHYDYDVFGVRFGGYAAGNWDLGRAFRLRAGVHAEWIRYDYETNLMPGNLAEDGSECAFGGCLFNRPADRDDTFFNAAPELTLTREFDATLAWLRLARGFRVPQATELYRLQRGQDVADLDSEKLDAVELGFRGAGRIEWELVGFYQKKRNFIFRDAEGFNVSDGRTRHYGIEFAVAHAIRPGLVAAARGTYARHEFRFDRDVGGEVIVSGNDIDSAPRRIASADLTWRPDGHWLAQLAFESTGRYYLNAENTRRYNGHNLWHAFVQRRFGHHWTASLRIRNLLNRRYAERADFAFGNFRYFPGPGRSVLASIEYAWDG